MLTYTVSNRHDARLNSHLSVVFSTIPAGTASFPICQLQLMRRLESFDFFYGHPQDFSGDLKRLGPVAFPGACDLPHWRCRRGSGTTQKLTAQSYECRQPKRHVSILGISDLTILDLILPHLDSNTGQFASWNRSEVQQTPQYEIHAIHSFESCWSAFNVVLWRYQKSFSAFQ